MPDLETLAAQIGEQLAATIQPMLKRLEDEMTAKIAASTVRSAMIDRNDELILTFGDGSTRTLGVVVGKDGVDGKDGAPGADGKRGKDGADGKRGERGIDGQAADPASVELIENRLSTLEARAVSGVMIDRSGSLVMSLATARNSTPVRSSGRTASTGKTGATASTGKTAGSVLKVSGSTIST